MYTRGSGVPWKGHIVLGVKHLATLVERRLGVQLRLARDGRALMLTCIIFAAVAFALAVESAKADPLQAASEFTVRIRTSIEHTFAEDDPGTSFGAGFVISQKTGWILTNAHVAGRGNATIEIAFKNKNYTEAKPIYVDPILDVAVLKIDEDVLPEGHKAAMLACQEADYTGTPVAAFGHPHGLDFSASRGIVSRARTYKGVDWLQTDAAINPGNSGGALISLETGEVIGINAMGFKDTEGLNFAVPSTKVCPILDLLVNDQIPSPPALPFEFATNSELDEHRVVATVSKLAFEAGLRPGDVVTSINGKAAKSPDDVITALRAFSGEASFGFQRSGQNMSVSLPIEPQKPLLNRPFILMDGALIASDVYPDRWMREGLFQIHSIRAGAAASRSDLKTFLLIKSVNGERPASLAHLYELLSSHDEIELITQYWSDRQFFLYDFKQIKYRPQDIQFFPEGAAAGHR